VDTNGGTTLNKRSGPGTSYAVVGSVADGVMVSISCSRNGTTYTGRYGSTSLWDRLSDCIWVSDAYLWTGANGAVNGYC
jgi:LasA protease